MASPSVPVSLADTATINSLIDAYFTWYNPAYPILHERTFRRECENRQQIHPRSTWHAIFFLVLAIGHWTVTEDAEQSHYYTAARSRMSMRMLESGTLLAVQAFLLMVWIQLYGFDQLSGQFTNCITGQLSPETRPAKYRLQFCRNRLSDGTWPRTSS